MLFKRLCQLPFIRAIVLGLQLPVACLVTEFGEPSCDTVPLGPYQNILSQLLNIFQKPSSILVLRKGTLQKRAV